MPGGRAVRRSARTQRLVMAINVGNHMSAVDAGLPPSGKTCRLGEPPIDKGGLREVPGAALADRPGERVLIVAGALATAVGMAWMAFVAAPDVAYTWLLAPMTLAGVGIAPAIRPTTQAVVSRVAPADLAKASGTFSTLRGSLLPRRHAAVSRPTRPPPGSSRPRGTSPWTWRTPAVEPSTSSATETASSRRCSTQSSPAPASPSCSPVSRYHA